MLDTILNNHLYLAAIILLLLVMIPALIVLGYRQRDSTRLDRRQRPRDEIDRRA